MMYSTRKIEGMLRHELDNWLRWGKKRDWMPQSFSCVLGRLYVSRYPMDSEARILEPAVNELGAARFERMVISLQPKHREAFIMHHLEKCIINGWVVKIDRRDDAARCIGMKKSQYHEMVNAAHIHLLGKYEARNFIST